MKNDGNEYFRITDRQRKKILENLSMQDPFWVKFAQSKASKSNMRCREKGFWATIIDFIFKESKIMVAIEEVTAKVSELSLVVDGIDVKLDEVKAYIDSLKGSVVTQEQLDELAALVDGVSEQAKSVKSEAEGLTPAVQPEPEV